MGKIIQVRSEILTPETFEPYGEILYGYGQPDIDWRDTFHLVDWLEVGWPRVVGSGHLCFEHLRMLRASFEFDMLERHVKSTQAFIPLGGDPSIFCLAPPTDPDDPDSLPDLDKVKAFILDGTIPINLHPGTWHQDPLPLREKADFLLVTRAELGQDDLGKVNFKDKLGVTFQILM
jgi:ureidoglycolate hydrolase